MKYMNFLCSKLLLFIIIGFFSFLPTCFSASNTSIDLPKNKELSLSQSKTTIKILSWNIYMLPAKSFLFTKQTKRAKLIVEALANTDYDIIVFQEAFHKKAFRVLAEGLKNTFPHQIGPVNKGGLIQTNSGIWIISKIPIKEIGITKFEDCHGVDCMARKGALLIEATKEGHTFQVLGTHMQASGPDENRSRQFQQLSKDLIMPNEQAHIPQILCGDYNIVKESELYQALIENIKAEDGALVGEWQQTSTTPDYGEPKHIIDYIFYKGNGKAPVKIERAVQRVTKEWTLKNKARLDLSDHFAVSIVLVF